MQLKESPKVYDVCIIGSGAGGGMAAKTLTQAGAETVMLEAGPDFDSSKGDMFKWPYESPRRGANTHRPFGEFDAAFGGWQIDGEPYTHTSGSRFEWFRSRMLGGRTNHWGRISLRFGPLDFQRKSVDGLGDNWPITYDDLKPYYDKIDKMIGLFGSVEGMPNEPDGIFMPPPRPRAHELLVTKHCKELKIPVIPARMSVLTQPLGNRPACHYCGECNRGCGTHSNFSSPSVLLRPAMETGKLKIITNAMAREILVNEEGLATGVSYVSKDDGLDYVVRAKIVIVAAGACGSARLMLNSKSTRHPGGLSNGSGVLGKYLMDSTGAFRGATIPQLVDWVPHNQDGIRGMQIYIPWWLNDAKLDFPRGYHIEVGGGTRVPEFRFGWGIEEKNRMLGDLDGKPRQSGGGYGEVLKDDYRRLYGARVTFAGRGEAIALESNYCEIDPTVVDKWGIPVLRFHYRWTDYERLQAKHMHETFEAIIDSMGGIPESEKPGAESDYGLDIPGRIIHEVGVARMGDDPGRSVVNKYCQAHEAKNVFVNDGATFVSMADKNPTWTILALSLRTSEYIINEMKKGNL
ncbi:MAG: GMC family oxidoreductase [Cyclobacteriaceae bacterium]|nr:GMC family oxidoreductase [Cyclobacteriaceae bacterium]